MTDNCIVYRPYGRYTGFVKFFLRMKVVVLTILFLLLHNNLNILKGVTIFCFLVLIGNIYIQRMNEYTKIVMIFEEKCIRILNNKIRSNRYNIYSWDEYKYAYFFTSHKKRQYIVLSLKPISYEDIDISLKNTRFKYEEICHNEFFMIPFSFRKTLDDTQMKIKEMIYQKVPYIDDNYRFFT